MVWDDDEEVLAEFVYLGIRTKVLETEVAEDAVRVIDVSDALDDTDYVVAVGHPTVVRLNALGNWPLFTSGIQSMMMMLINSKLADETET